MGPRVKRRIAGGRRPRHDREFASVLCSQEGQHELLLSVFWIEHFHQPGLAGRADVSGGEPPCLGFHDQSGIFGRRHEREA